LITATSPALAAGKVDITVVTPGGTSATSANDAFSFLVPGVDGSGQQTLSEQQRAYLAYLMNRPYRRRRIM